MAQELARYDAARVHGHRLERDDLEVQIGRLAGATQAAREGMAGLDPRRADVILAGAYILQGVMQRLGAGTVLVNDRGIRWGLFYQRLAER
jgi:exopolyphosphatase/guanosine-5'-triphosphate,3'-diphosphate pyrophosphatase